ncbi:MAG TPA: AmmeMemoRadiSam system protein A [Acidobacteriota bacterium]|nr:AmmeMemoRadiSam system protein A [Acidobacteriota bacterium]
MLGESEKTALLTIARKTLESYLADEKIPPFAVSCDMLLERKGAFVTLHEGNKLRGCIGQIYPDTDLYRIVQRCAVSAALEDPRFAPVKKEELEDLTIEISVLSPFRQVRDSEEIEVGKHGLFIVQGIFRGLLLPQVATEHRWGRVEFLEHACRKAGLNRDAWKDAGTEINIFEADVFSE